MKKDNGIPFKLKTGPTKPFKTIDEQVDLLKSRGLIIEDDENTKDILRRTNYYRISGYSLTMRNKNAFNKGASFDQIYEIYRLDDAFRKIILNYSSTIEIAFRSYISYRHAEKYGPLGYMYPDNFERADRHAQFIDKITDEVDRSDDVFVAHHKLDLNNVFPVWVILECSSFGELSKLFKNLKTEDRAFIAKNEYDIAREYVENWLQAIVMSRNIAAHCGRFFNRKLKSVQIKLPKKVQDIIAADSAFAVIYAMHRLQPTNALADALRADLVDLFNKYPNVDKTYLGFPEKWLELLEANATIHDFDYIKTE